MSFPFVTRRAFAMLEVQRDELKQELAKARADYEYLMNQFIWRGTKIPLDPSKLPADYREAAIPKKEPVIDPASVLNDPKKAAEQPMSARARLRQIEDQRDQEFEEKHGGIKIVKDQEASA